MANTSNNRFGLFLTGTLLGHKQQSGVSRATGKPFTIHYIGIEQPFDGGFPGETRIHYVQVSEKLMNSGLLSKIQPLLGKEVQASVYVRAFPSRSGAGYSFNLSNDVNAVQVLKDG